MPMSPKSFRLAPRAPRGEKSAATIERCKKYRTKAWTQIREHIIARDGMECRECGRVCIGKRNAHVDHIVSVVDGGTDDESNLRLLCASCHSRRTARENMPGGGSKTK